MKITGVIMECNPFHEGHRYFLEQARTVTGCDRLIAVMSGDYVQRGEPAILPKEIRARGSVLRFRMRQYGRDPAGGPDFV